MSPPGYCHCRGVHTVVMLMMIMMMIIIVSLEQGRDFGKLSCSVSVGTIHFNFAVLGFLSFSC